MLLVTLALNTLLSISQNGISPITLNKQLGNHLNNDIINASISLSSFSFHGCVQLPNPSLTRPYKG
jgi:hypothetical protein